MTSQSEAQDKIFLITGGASGLGAEYAKIFLQLGAKNVAVLDIAEAVGKTYVASLNETYPGKAMFIKCDVSKEDEIKSAFQQVLDANKRIDVIINNAGMLNDSPHLWRTACDVNWQGSVSFTLKGMEHMRKDKGGAGGTIINISSAAALLKSPSFPMYCAAKLAVLHFSQTLSVPPFFDRTGIRILTICIGPTCTPIMENLHERSLDIKLGETYLKTIDDPGLYQRIEPVVTAFVKMFKEGEPGSIWLSIKNKPGIDITSDINQAFDEFKMKWLA
ncbi:15-hydroxyprostaglandin dehydrogenase [NAD(+)]-like [Leptidea sinapis]|uniref:15-hydroxyprostaglandin dehydrogenase [NAD(+)]-like n=1 Tax=Leptidea sinapis TaxID=189913 RepID=UPI0021C2F383|nr:15-hydroxyprostaglandin dehydrogenase [NAD(+)]-like [Leptidea sinapis]XP_050665828.1 15-hydroxyprostaglandin dehydrogenase [NAD(+)]-like [Leptidea sinapis]